MVEVAEPLLEDLSNSAVLPPAPSQFGQLSYSQQYDHLFAQMPLDVKKPVPKPSPAAQRVRVARLRLSCCPPLPLHGVASVCRPSVCCRVHFVSHVRRAHRE